MENFDEILTAGGPGVLWTLGQSDDLNANLVRFAPGEGVGAGEISIEWDERPLVAGVLALVPNGASRSIRSDSEDFAYLSDYLSR